RLPGMAALLLAVAGLVLAGCSSPAPGPGSGPGAGSAPGPGTGSATSGRFGARQADALVKTTMTTNNTANSKLDERLLASYETGSALDIDAAQYRGARLSGTNAGSTPFALHLRQTVIGPSSSGRATDLESFVAVGRSYLLKKQPRSAKSSCPHPDTVLVFESRHGGAYKIALEPSADAGAVPRITTSRRDLAPALSAPLARSAARLPGAIATALERYEASGKLGGLSKGDFSGVCWALPNPRAELREAARAGFEERDLYRATGSVVSYPVSGHRAFVIFTLRSAESILAPSGNYVEWQHSRDDPSSYLLASGHYSRVTEQSEIEVAATTGAVSGASRMLYEIIGSYEGIVSIAGTRVSGGSGQLTAAPLPGISP
ncbi:MAG: hypothetical protein ACRDZ6_00475, partial [Acidimicrobiales bacterium]